MRVIHIAKHCSYANGNVHVAVDLACMQARAGYTVAFVSGGGTFVEMLQQHGVRHVTLRQDQRRPLTFVTALIGLLRLSRELRPAIFHAHMMGGAVIGYLASLLTGAKLVTTVHNSFDPHSFLMRLGHRAVSVSRAERSHLIERGYKPARLSVVWNAPANSPRGSFMRNGHDVALKRPCVVAACALHRRKGVFDLIDAFATLRTDFPEWRLYIAGEGPDEASLQARSAALGVADRVTFLGFVPDPWPLYQQSDIFVLASYADPGSLSIGEARAAGCAIIGTAVGGTTEMLDHGAAGRLVAPGAPQQLAEALCALMQDPAARASLRAAALHGAEIFDAGRLVRDYEQVYRDALCG